MTYATILVLLDDHAGMDDRIDEAARLARRFESHLVGVASTDRRLLAPGLGAALSSTPRQARIADDGLAMARARVAHFAKRLSTLATPVSFEAIVEDNVDDVTALVRRSACGDLLVLSQADPSWPAFARCRDQVEQVVLRSAAPVLVVPYAGRRSLRAEHVMIAWDGSHGASRAVVGALPLLQQARRVDLVHCATVLEADANEEFAGFDPPREWLGRHGVRVDAKLERSGTDVGAALLSRAAALGADLAVMGAWGMPRWAERLVGGTTRTLLSTTNVPLLMSH